jgi:hypothetical protein
MIQFSYLLDKNKSMYGQIIDLNKQWDIGYSVMRFSEIFTQIFLQRLFPENRIGRIQG